MKKLNFLILIVYSITNSSAWAAIKTPVGSWQLATTTQVEITAPTGKKKVKGPKLTGVEFATFLQDYSYISSEWINRLNVYFNDSNGRYLKPLDAIGQWYGTTTTFTVSYDITALSFFNANNEYINAPFFDRIGYINLLFTNLGYTPTIDSIQILSYSDKGMLIKDGQGLSGTKKIIFQARWKHPDTSIPTAAIITVNTNYIGKRQTISSVCCGTDGAQNAIDSQAFLTAIAGLNGVKKTSTGLEYIVLQEGEGSGTSPKATDKVTFNYRGFYPSNEIFDSNSIISFPLNQVIAGWTEGLQLMKKGAKFRFFIPADIAYGEAVGSSVKPNSALVFDVE